MGGSCSTNGEMRNMYRILVGKPEGKIYLRRSRCKWKGSIKMDLKEIGYDYIDLIQMDQNRLQWRSLVNTKMNLRILQMRRVSRAAE
jgi:hypothetical protein